MKMALQSLTDLEAYGTMLQPASNVPFSVEEPESVWIVEAGKLDLFLLDLKDGQPVGARFHVMRIDERNAVFGVGTHLPGVALMATAAPETRLLHISRHSLASEPATHIKDMASDGLAQRLVENWIGRLSAAISESMA